MATGWKKILHEESAAADFPTLNQDTTGSAATLTTAQNFSLTGDVTATAVSFDGSGAVALSTSIANGAVDVNAIGTAAVSTNELKDLAVTTAKINADAVDGTKIADDSINSEHYVDGSIDTAHIADLNITTVKIADEAVDTNKIGDDAVEAHHLNATAITGQTAETSIADDDVVLIYDTSASALKKMTKANLVSGLSADTTLSTEEVQDIVGGMVDGGTETRVSVTYDDANGKLNFVVDDMTADNNTFRTVEIDTDGDGTANETLGATETLRLIAGTDISITENAGKVTFSADSQVDSAAVKSALNANLGTLTLGDSDDTISIPGNLEVSGATTTISTGELHVEDVMIKLADVASPTTTTGNNAGIQVEVSGTEAEFPELKWNNSQKLTGWTLSDYKATSNTDFPVAVMNFGTAAPSGVPDPGQGTLFADATNNELYIYV